jgi:hypothetical protein
MKNYFDILEHLIEQLLVSHATLNEIEIATNLLDVFTVTSREIIEDADARAFRH